MIVDTYGVPNYKEVNPAVFACVTFPFLFGVMFGDIMHGGLLLGFALYLYWVGRENSPVAAMWDIKHFLLLMGFFSTFCGFCYNDYSSVPLYLFGESCYVIDMKEHTATQKPGCVYPIGVDPIWYLSAQELTFMNSIKMKIAVIFGVWQMSLGIILRGCNNAYHRQWIDFFFEFLPQITILLCLFGYMDLLIVMKWLTNWEGRTANAPSVISTMVDMFLNGGNPTLPTDEPIFATMK
jgi:V-type H+-transporting ATPase subunit a